MRINAKFPPILAICVLCVNPRLVSITLEQMEQLSY